MVQPGRLAREICSSEAMIRRQCMLSKSAAAGSICAKAACTEKHCTCFRQQQNLLDSSALDIAQSNYTRKDVSVDGILRTLTRTDWAFINLRVRDFRYRAHGNRPPPSDHTAIPVAIQKNNLRRSACFFSPYRFQNACVLSQSPCSFRIVACDPDKPRCQSACGSHCFEGVPQPSPCYAHPRLRSVGFGWPTFQEHYL